MASLASTVLLLVKHSCLWLKYDLNVMAPLQMGLAIAILLLFEGIDISRYDFLAFLFALLVVNLTFCFLETVVC